MRDRHSTLRGTLITALVAISMIISTTNLFAAAPVVIIPEEGVDESVGGTSSDTLRSQEEQSSEESTDEEDGPSIGNIDDIGEGTIVINDQGYLIDDKTVFIARSGARTTLKSFKAGDIVTFTFSEKPLTVLTLEKSTEADAHALQQEQTDEVQRSGDMILKDGVWTN